MFVEKRKYPRVNFNLPIKLSDIDYDTVTETRDISGNGIRCYIDKQIPPMTKLKITLLIPVKKNNKKTLKRISCRGVVVRGENTNNTDKYSYNIAVYFNEIKESDRKTILAYINSPLKKTVQ